MDLIEFVLAEINELMTEGVKKAYQNPEGGLNAKGRAHYNR